MADSNTFSLRIVSLDYYMAYPIPGLDISYSSFHGGKVSEVPVIRIYGSTPAGQRTCLHVHQVFPYLYVPCADIPIQDKQEGDAYTHQISLALEKALKLKSKASSKRQYVHGCSLVRAKKFYGYHSSEDLFVKIYLYHPQDVSRAANLLLGGGVLHKSLQPHEAHIPYILQFLVDYNLYGMGHVHLSKLKFRHPVPDVFSPRKSVHTEQARQERETRTHGCSDFMADMSGRVSFSLPVWISSTIPADWMWHSPSEFNESSSNPEINAVKRVSLCQLEGDASVDDILNQQGKTYTSLSQTHSDVKMVRSLVPIWEEEYERTGMHDIAIPSDPSKPLPENVLKTLSLDPKVLIKRVQQLHEEEMCPYLIPSDKDAKPTQLPTLLKKEGILVAHDHISYNVGETSDGIKERSVIGSLPSQYEDAIPSMERNANVKATDEEAVGLLKWLASSQAMDDINSDDELLRESILSPFLPATTIEEVLEKANMEYESESQKECQEILDSIDDIVAANCVKERADSLEGENSPGPSYEFSIPQVDGAGDNIFLTPPDGSTETHSEIEHNMIIDETCQQPVLREDALLENKAATGVDSSCTHKHKKKKKLWGSLPFSVNQKLKNERESINLCTETQGPILPSPISLCKGGQLEDSLTKNIKETPPMVGCSVRDLMRRKRLFRVEPVQCNSRGVEKVPFQTRHKEDAGILQKCLYFQTFQVDEPSRRPCESFNINSPPDSQSMLHAVYDVNATDGDSPLNGESCSHDSDFDSSGAATQSGNVRVSGPLDVKIRSSLSDPRNLDSAATINDCKNGQDTDVQLLNSSHEDKNFSVLRLEPTGAASSSCFQIPNSYDKMSGRIGRKELSSEECAYEMPCEKLAGANESAITFMSSLNIGQGQEGTITQLMKTDPQNKDPISLTFCRKPPTTDCTDQPSRTTPFPVISNLPSDTDSCEGNSGKFVDDFLPFFMNDCQENAEIRNNHLRASDSTLQQDSAIGVPILYQNDGSFLYLLSPVVSPPPTEKVERWLSTGTSSGNASTSTKSYAQQGTSGNLICSPSSSPDDFSKAASEFGSICDQHIEAQGSQENCRDIYSARNVTCNDDAARVQKEGESASKACSDYSQDNSQISGPASKPTPLSQIGFRDPASSGGGQQLTLLSIEVQAASRGDLRPDPRFDAINIVTLVAQNDNVLGVEVHVLLCSKAEDCQRNLDGTSGCSVLMFHEEKYLLNHFIKFICSLDPDILMGWDVQGSSLGFLAERASHLGIGLLKSISRTPSETKMTAGDLEIPEKGLDNRISNSVVADPSALENAIIEDEWGRTHASGVRVDGRIILNIWRLMRGELNLNMYTLEAVADAVLRRKIPYIPHKVLTRWFSSGPGRARYRCIEYVKERANLNLELMNQLDMINRTSELARVFGIDFFSVLSRGSQYRVESMYLRLAHTQNYLAISPGNSQVASQPAMECLPLVMEPESGFYADPVVVLDFQSLYPSMIIAYNLCYSTCLGNIAPSKENVLGVSVYSPDPHVLEELKDQILLTPNGVMYAPSKVRKGVLPRLLEEILSTRIMVKQAMKKLSPSQQVLHRIFNARQLALKLIANVTYGYTAAGFSGRMPCAELADSIVQCGRRTLETAISFVNSQEKWRAKVIYGDTDSMFVLLKGRTVEDAFRIGNEIASEITAMNPNPVVLKMEKVYHPCFLFTKKRYVGYSYESPKQAEPIFDAKGIETVRRDTCRAVSKTMEQSLRLFFESQDISEVKAYLQRQWQRILSGRVSLQDFVFAKEVRLGTYSSRDSSLLPPAAIVATKAMRTDPRAEPRYGDRIPYVVIHGQPGARLVDMVVDPLELLAVGSPYRLNDLYYITKQIIPALQRVFGLIRADLNKWFLEMPRQVREAFGKRPLFASNPQKTRIDFYYLSKHCILCGELVEASTHLCQKCSQDKTAAVTAVVARTSKLEREMQHLAAICRHCGGGDWLVESGVKCTSLACPVFYERSKVQKELQGLATVAADKDLYPKCMVEWF